MRPIPAYAVVVILAVLLAPIAHAQTVTLRLAHASSTGSLIDQAVLRFAGEVSRLTAGKVKIQDFPNGELGDEGPIAEGVGSGAIDIGLGGVVDPIDPRLNVLALPFLFSSFAQVHAVLDGPFGKRLLTMGAAHGYHMLGFLDSGFRDFADTRRPIVTPANLKGLKIRVPPIPVILQTMRAFGALPQSIPFDQVYTALQSHVVDGVEPELRDFYDQKWYEVVKYLSLSNYIWTANYWYMNKARYDSLTPAEQRAIDQAVADTTAWYRGQLGAVYASILHKLPDYGVKVNKLDTAPFRAMVAPIYKHFAELWGAELVASARAAADATQH